MQRLLVLTLSGLLLLGCDGSGDGSDGGDASDASGSDARVPGRDSGSNRDAGPGADSGPEQDAGLDGGPVTDAGPPTASPGCGMSPELSLGGVQASRTFSTTAGGERSFYVTLPSDYDPDTPHRIVVGFSGTNWVGHMIRPYLDLERSEDTIYVYPDLRFRDFDGWGNLGGWLLGPHARPADGVEDIEFVRELLDHLEQNYCVDRGRVFATGHSWGGDMTAVVGCFLGDRFTAVAPAAANRPYWFEPSGGELTCVGEAAVWTWFGQNETHFTGQPFPGAFGDEQNDFWRDKHACGEATTTLSEGDGDCIRWEGCTRETRYCFYDPSAGHQIPSYFSAAVTAWFESF